MKKVVINVVENGSNASLSIEAVGQPAVTMSVADVDDFIIDLLTKKGEALKRIDEWHDEADRKANEGR